jgi:transcriptional regulator GlxA family with amidase domain
MVLIAQSQIRDVAILVFEGVELLDFTGPYEVFHAARGFFRVATVAHDTELLSSNAGLAIKPSHSFGDCPEPDIVVIPGGHVRAAIEDPTAMTFLRRALHSAKVVMSVCNGAHVLAELGALDGLTVTTHHGAIDNLRQRAPKANVVDDRRWVDNGKIITAAGVSSGIDATLHLIDRLHGNDVARDVEEYIEFSRRKE